MFTLSPRIKNIIAKKTGLTVDEISTKSQCEIIRLAPPDRRLKARGSVYINEERMLSSEKIDKLIARIQLQ